MKLLTIAIPTFNRSQYLRSCLDALCPNITDEIQIVVRDNCSTNYFFDDFITPYVDKYGVIPIKNKVNIAMEGNIVRCFEECETKWLWILGDDDIVKKEAIKDVLNIVKSNDDSFYIKFGSHYDVETRGLGELTNVMKGLYDFSDNYFLSESIHNVQEKSCIYKQYRQMSMCITQILRVLDKCIEDNSTKCVFTRQEIIEDHGSDISWSHYRLVPYFLNIFDIYSEQYLLFRDNIFRNVSFVCWCYVHEANIPLQKKIYYYILICFKYGFYNMITKNFVSLLVLYLTKIKKLLKLESINKNTIFYNILLYSKRFLSKKMQN